MKKASTNKVTRGRDVAPPTDGARDAKAHRSEVVSTSKRSQSTEVPRPASAQGRSSSAVSDKSSSAKRDAVSPAPQPKAWKAPQPLLSAIVFVGSYHNVAAAYAVRKTAIAPKFTSSSHVGSITSVATCGRFFVSSGADEALSIHSVKDHGAHFVDFGKVTPPCQINSISFPDPRFLICAADDGTLIIYKTREWTCAAVIAAHERAAVDVAVHPTGALAVSVGLDNMVVVVDMVRASVVARRKLDKSLGSPMAVRFSEDGGFFAIQTQYTVSIFDTATATEVARASFEKDPPNEIQTIVLTSSFIAPSKTGARAVSIIAAVESGMVFSARLTVNAKDIATSEDEKAPAKLLRVTWVPVTVSAPAELQLDPENPAFSAIRRIRTMQLGDGTLFAASSSGEIRVFDLVSADGENFTATLRARHPTGGRITSLSVFKKSG